MNRLGVLDPSQLPIYAALETISTEDILAARMRRLVELWRVYDPPAAAIYDISELEFDPIKINQEVSTYFELMQRDRVNQACRAVTTAYGTNGDLDAIGSRYPGGQPRLNDESDDEYRRRLWLSPSTLSPHGTEEAYVYWALTADRTLRDATATTIEGTGQVNVTIMAEGPDPRPTTAQLLAVRAYIRDYSRKGLTDILSVFAPRIVQTRYALDVWLYPGPDAVPIMINLRRNLEALVERQNWLGFDHTRMAIATACGNVSGVQNVHIREPAQSISVDLRGLVEVTGIDLSLKGRRE
jgi:phage-related baseplate assembly protein